MLLKKRPMEMCDSSIILSLINALTSGGGEGKGKVRYEILKVDSKLSLAVLKLG